LLNIGFQTLPKFNPFDENLRNGQKWEVELLRKISRIRLKEKIKFLTNNDEFQRKGIDGILYAEKAKIDPKTRGYFAYKYNDVLIETLSVIEQKKLGWWYTTEADIIAYVWKNPSGTNLIDGYFIFVQDKNLRSWFEQYKIQHLEKRRIASSERNGSIWHTENFAVPIKDFPKGTIMRFNPHVVSKTKNGKLDPFLG